VGWAWFSGRETALNWNDLVRLFTPWVGTFERPRGRVVFSTERNEVLRRPAALGGTRTLSSVAPVAAGYERDTSS